MSEDKTHIPKPEGPSGLQGAFLARGLGAIKYPSDIVDQIYLMPRQNNTLKVILDYKLLLTDKAVNVAVNAVFRCLSESGLDMRQVVCDASLPADRHEIIASYHFPTMPNENNMRAALTGIRDAALAWKSYTGGRNL